MVWGRFWAILDPSKNIIFCSQINPENVLISIRVYIIIFWAFLSNKIDSFKMAKNRSKPWTIVHGFGSILGHFGPFRKNIFWPQISQENVPISIRVHKMIVWVIFWNEIDSFKMAKNRSKPWTIVHGFGSILGHFRPFQKIIFWPQINPENVPTSIRVDIMIV